ncbi:MAG: hypothetical protein ACLQQ0_10765, partial [Limisphaerales bacterium]
LALSLSPLGGERVAEGRVRCIRTGLKANQYQLFAGQGCGRVPLICNGYVSGPSLTGFGKHG